MPDRHLPLIAPSVDRRHLLRQAAAAAAGSWLSRGAWAQRRWSFDPFSLGVASGSPAPDGVVLWTRLVAPGLMDSLGEAAVPVRWEVAHDEAFAQVVQRGETVASAELAHSVHAEVQGLAPDRWYCYRFIAGGVTSPTGRTRTLPSPQAAVKRLRLAYASCQRWEHGYYAAYRHMREDQPDLVMFLGDYIYEYPNASAAVRNFPTLARVLTLADYRERHALHRSDPHLQAMHAACPWLVTWDDHEVQNDYAGMHEGDGAPIGLNGVTDFLARRHAAYQAYYEHMPLRASAFMRSVSGVGVRLHERYRYGQLADLLLLDTRQFRDIQVCGTPQRRTGAVDPAGCDTWLDPARTMLGAAQERWLDDTLARSGPGWTVLGQQGLFGRRDNLPGPGERLWNDGWDGYAPARQRLTDSLRRHRVANPVVLGGDVHENWVGHVKADYARPDSASIGVEFCGTSITSRANASPRTTAQRLAENPHFVFGDASQRGYGLCEWTPGAMTTTLRVLDDATRPDARIETQARFTVQAGRPVIERA
ncbi:MAG: putative alkaline phosphatase precursor [Pseudomonadota bacterium]|jgi:alkaline phosphatase D